MSSQSSLSSTQVINSKPYKIALDKPVIMGVLNVTPDSFFDGGKYNNSDAALAQVEKMVSEGVDIIDVGGESTRPAPKELSVDEELDRVIPIIEQISSKFSIPISIDTSKATVMREAMKVGASIINDTRALQSPDALEAAIELQVPVCLMHMQSNPKTMQDEPYYEDVVWEVTKFLTERARQCVAAGILQENIIIDPGFCFGKKLEHSLTLLKNLETVVDTKIPVLVGISNKSMTALSTILSGRSASSKIGDRDIIAKDYSCISSNMDRAKLNTRFYNSIAANTIAFMKGASIFRTHDVLPTVQALNFARDVYSI